MKVVARVGDKIVLKRKVGSMDKGTVLEVTNVYPNEPKYSCNRLNSTMTTSINSANIEPLSRKKCIEILTDKEKDLKEELKDVENELKFYRDYESEEDFLAHKIVDILKNKDDVGAIKEILSSRYTRIL